MYIKELEPVTMLSIVQTATSEVFDAEAAVREALANVAIAEEILRSKREALVKAKVEQVKADELAGRFLTHCHAGEKLHEFNVATMNSYQNDGPTTRVQVGWAPGYWDPWTSRFRDDYPIFETVRTPGPWKNKASLVCKHCGAKVELTNA